jgi:hypothetical protein
VLLLQSGKTALMEASGRGHTEVVQALIGAGANPHLQDEVGGDHSDAFQISIRGMTLACTVFVL